MTGNTGTQFAEDQEPNAEMCAVNEKLVIAAVRHQELAEKAVQSAESAQKSNELYRLLAEHFPNSMVFLFDHDLRHRLADGQGILALGFSNEATGSLMKKADTVMYEAKKDRAANVGEREKKPL